MVVVISVSIAQLNKTQCLVIKGAEMHSKSPEESTSLFLRSQYDYSWTDSDRLHCNVKLESLKTQNSLNTSFRQLQV
jgi:hypothetical protein